MSPKHAAYRRFLLAPVLCLSACDDPGSTTGVGDATAAAEETKPARTVVTELAAVVNLRRTVELTAEAAPWAAVTVAAEATGRIVELPVEAGDPVDAKTVLARIDDAKVRAELDQARAEVAQAEATLAQAERALERGRELATTRDISEDDLDRLTLAYDTAQPRLAAARARVTMKQQSLDGTVVRAPFAGVISERFVELGSWIATGSPLVRVVDQRRIKMIGAASQRDRARLRTGMPAEVRLEALPGVTFEGRVRLLGQEADQRTGTYRVEVAVDDPRAPFVDGSADGSAGDRLLPGLQGTLVVELGARQALTIPRSALFLGAGGEGVFTVRAGTARWVTPEVGTMSEDRAEILSGLEEGDPVVTLGQHMLHDGDPVLIAAGETEVDEAQP